MFVIEAASRACKIAKGQRSGKLNTHFLPEGIQSLLPCLVSQLAPLAELVSNTCVSMYN